MITIRQKISKLANKKTATMTSRQIALMVGCRQSTVCIYLRDLNKPYIRCSPRNPEEIRQNVGFRLPRWIIDWLRRQPESQGQLIEKGLVKTYNLKKPN